VTGQAVVAARAGVVVGAHILVAGVADPDRPADKLERRASAAISERAAANIRKRIIPVHLDERRVARQRIAPPINHAQRTASKQGRRNHLRCLCQCSPDRSWAAPTGAGRVAQGARAPSAPNWATNLPAARSGAAASACGARGGGGWRPCL